MTSTAEAVAVAWRSLVARDDMPTVRAVQAELIRLRGVCASLRDIVPVVAALRSESEADPRIATVVDMFQRIDIVAQREALRRMTDSNSTQRGTQ